MIRPPGLLRETDLGFYSTLPQTWNLVSYHDLLQKDGQRSLRYSWATKLAQSWVKEELHFQGAEEIQNAKFSKTLTEIRSESCGQEAAHLV